MLPLFNEWTQAFQAKSILILNQIIKDPNLLDMILYFGNYSPSFETGKGTAGARFDFMQDCKIFHNFRPALSKANEHNCQALTIMLSIAKSTMHVTGLNRSVCLGLHLY